MRQTLLFSYYDDDDDEYPGEEELTAQQRQQLEKKRLAEQKKREAEQKRLEKEKQKKLEEKAKLKAARKKEADARKKLAEVRLTEFSDKLRSRSGSAAKSLSSFFSSACASAKKGYAFADKTAGKINRVIVKIFSFRITALLLAALALFLYVSFAKDSTKGAINLTTMTSKVRECTYQFYICDYSCGFCSRLLIGAILTALYGKVNLHIITLVANAAMLAAVIGQSLITGIVMRRAILERDRIAFLITFLFIFNPLTTVENYPLLGSLDPFILILFMLWLLTTENILSPLTAPLVSALCMTVHYEYLFTFLPAVLVILMYKGFCGKDRKTRRINAASFWVTSASSGGLFVYFVFFAVKCLKMTSDEYYAVMESHFYVTEKTEKVLREILYNGNLFYREYFDYYIFGEYQGDSSYAEAGNFLSFLRNYTKENTFDLFAETLLKYVAPVMLMFFIMWVYCAIKEKGGRRLPYIAAALIPLALVPELIISTDVWRWISAAEIAQFAVFFAIYRDSSSTLRKMFKTKLLKGFIPAVIFLYLMQRYHVHSLEIAPLFFFH